MGALYRDLQGGPVAGGTAAAAGQLPTFGAWQARVRETGEGTTTVHDLWGQMLAAVPRECCVECDVLSPDASALLRLSISHAPTPPLPTELGPEAIQAILGRYPTPAHLHAAYAQRKAAAAGERTDPHLAAERLLHGLTKCAGLGWGGAWIALGQAGRQARACVGWPGRRQARGLAAALLADPPAAALPPLPAPNAQRRALHRRRPRRRGVHQALPPSAGRHWSWGAGRDGRVRVAC